MTCTPETTRDTAPSQGNNDVYDAGDAGSVQLERTSATDFNITQVTPNTGWTDEVTAQSGPRVKVKFTNSAGPPWVVRFAASMDQAGREIHIRVTTCQ
jgi:hypothetical protein